METPDKYNMNANVGVAMPVDQMQQPLMMQQPAYGQYNQQPMMGDPSMMQQQPPMPMMTQQDPAQQQAAYLQQMNAQYQAPIIAQQQQEHNAQMASMQMQQNMMMGYDFCLPTTSTQKCHKCDARADYVCKWQMCCGSGCAKAVCAMHSQIHTRRQKYRVFNYLVCHDCEKSYQKSAMVPLIVFCVICFGQIAIMLCMYFFVF